VLRRAKTVKNASESERDALLDDAETLETWAAYLVLGAIVLEAVVWASPLCPFLFKLGNFVSDAAVAVGVYAEMRFGHVVADILKIRLADAVLQAGEAKERAAKAELRIEELRTQTRPRVFNFNRAAMITALDGRPKVPIEILFDEDESDAAALASAIYGAFRSASWRATIPAPIPPDPPAPAGLEVAYASGPKHFIQGMQAWGLSVVKRESDNILESLEAVQHALAISTGQGISGAENDFVSPGMIRVMIGPRP
jgi:hypothetical protein